VTKPRGSSGRRSHTARKRKQQVELSEDVRAVSMNSACTPERGALSRSGSTPTVSHESQSQTSLLRHMLLEQQKRHNQDLNQESSPIIVKESQVAKFSEAAHTPSSYTNSLRTQTSIKSILKPVMTSLQYVGWGGGGRYLCVNTSATLIVCGFIQ
jgi:hypothetical protein